MSEQTSDAKPTESNDVETLKPEPETISETPNDDVPPPPTTDETKPETEPEQVPEPESAADEVKTEDAKSNPAEESPQEEPPEEPTAVEPNADSATERKQSTASDVAEEPEKHDDTNDELQNMIKELSEPRATISTNQSEEKPQETGKETTENLLSVLEDGLENQTKDKPEETPVSESSSATTSNPVAKPNKPKKYLYKLKSKTGKILHYTSTVPITLKRPVIHLTKMEDTSKKDPLQKVLHTEKDDVDSDNSSKENNLKENEAPNDNVIKTVRKKGRPPLSSRPPPPVITLDGNSSDTADGSKSTPSFSMQTRKRQLKFLPDGRLLTPQKRVKTEDKKSSASSSDSELDIISSDTEKPTETSVTPAATPSTPASVAKIAKKLEPSVKKFKPEMKLVTGEKRKYKKVFDYESYYREKTGVPPPGIVRTALGNRSFAPGLTPIRKQYDTPRLKPILPSGTSTPKKPSSVDPAQLLSSLIGVPINSSQLNVVKFKPKIIQERTNSVVASTPKKVTFEDDKTKFAPANQSELLKSTPFKIVSKPTYQKILPKPSGIEKTPLTQSRIAYQPINIDNKYATNSVYVSSSPFLRESLQDTLAKFDSFSDSKVVKTKEGPRRALKRKQDDDAYLKDNNAKTLYDLMYEIFDKMPSWNLHVIPDTNCFCIAQVSRGRMGIPTLKKSIEINSEFFAKVYVHQLQCKRYDGIYDTESKIVKLIKEIDALAA